MGGFSCKVHALTDALGHPLRFILTAGQASDVGQAENLLIGIQTLRVMMDKDYESFQMIVRLEKRGITVLCPPRSNAINPRKCDFFAYKERHLVEYFFGKLKHYRRVFSRFDKKDINFMSFLHFTSIMIMTR